MSAWPGLQLKWAKMIFMTTCRLSALAAGPILILAVKKIWPFSTPDDADWYPIQLATNSFGQGVAVTPIQIATAISAVANDGKMMKPHVLKAIIQDGKQYNTSPQVLSVPIKA